MEGEKDDKINVWQGYKLVSSKGLKCSMYTHMIIVCYFAVTMNEIKFTISLKLGRNTAMCHSIKVIKKKNKS